MVPLGEDFPEIREGVRAICKRYPDKYWRDLEDADEYAEEFVTELSRAGYLGALIPEDYGGAGLPIRAGCVILDELLLPDAQVSDQCVEVDPGLQSPQHFGGAVSFGAAVDLESVTDATAEKDVLYHRKIGAEIELLEDDADALPRGIAHRP